MTREFSGGAGGDTIQSIPPKVSRDFQCHVLPALVTVAVKLHPACVGQMGTRAPHELLRREAIGSKMVTTWLSPPLEEEAIFVWQEGANQVLGERWCDKGSRRQEQTGSENESANTAVSFFQSGTLSGFYEDGSQEKPRNCQKPWQSGTFRQFNCKVEIRRSTNDQSLEDCFVESPKDSKICMSTVAAPRPSTKLSPAHSDLFFVCFLRG